LHNGLVDKLGGLDQAVVAAAALADLESYRRQVIELPLTPQEQFLRGLGNVLSPIKNYSINSQWQQLLAPFRSSLDLLSQMNDPRGIYLQCAACVAP